MRRTTSCACLLLLAGCAAPLGGGPPESGFARDALQRARGLGPRRADDASRLEALLEGLTVSNPARASAAGGPLDAEGLLVLDPEAEAFVREVADPARVEHALGSRALDQEHLLLAAYARNPGVQSARASWRAAVRMLDQVTYLEGVLARYRAFTETASPTGIDRPMRAPAFPYPGTVALRGAMVALEVRMASEDARMRLRDALAACVMVYVEALARTEEVQIRDDQVALTERLLASARARATAGTSPNAEVLEAEVELAMARSQRTQTAEEADVATARLNTLLGREPSASLRLVEAGPLPSQAPPLADLLGLAAEYSPEIRMAAAQAERTAVAIRMGEAMLLSPAGPRAPAANAGPALAAPAPMTDGRRSAGRSGGMVPMGGGVPAPGLAPPGGEAAPMGPGGMDEAAGAQPQPTFAQDAAWLAELRERRVALERAADESRRSVERGVLEARLAFTSAQRMLSVAESTSAPLARQALAERLSAYETGRSEFGELVSALARVLETRRQVVEGRRMLREAEARLWMAVGARPSVVAAGVRADPR